MDGLAVGASASVTLVLKSPGLGSFNQSFVVTSNASDPFSGNNSATATTTFSPATHFMSLSRTGSGTGTVIGSGTYGIGTSATVAASSDAGSDFVGWAGANAAECATGSVLMNASKNCAAEDRNNRLLNYFRLAKGFARSAELPPAAQYGAMTRVLAPDLLAAAPPDGEAALAPFADALAACDASDLLDRILYVDLKTSLPEQLLLLTDKMSMACSLEVRVPYLDYRVVEFAARIPVHMKIRGRELRHIQKRTFAGRLPKAVLNRRKRGFGAPIGTWLRGDLREMVEDLLSAPRLSATGLFNAPQVRALVEGHMNRRLDGTDAVLALLTFELWREEFIRH